MLVTGGAGFVGRHLTAKLLEAGNEVVILDNLSNSKKDNLPKGADFIKGDIRDPSDLTRVMKGCDIMFHLAAITDLRSEDQAEYDVNYLGAKKTFDIAKKNGIKVVFSSSAAVYGNGSCLESSDCKPISQYGKSKLKAENYAKKELPDIFIARFFNIYGPGSKSVINAFAKNIPNYKPIKIIGNGMQTRDFVYISDAIDALILGIENKGIFNVGTGREASLLEIIDTMHNITKAKPEYKFELPNDKEIKRSKADISQIKGIGWSAKIALDEGIRLVLLSEGWKPLP